MNAVSGRPVSSAFHNATSPRTPPPCSSRRTRWCAADTDSPVRLASSVKLIRPSADSSSRIWRSISSTRTRYSPRARCRWRGQVTLRPQITKRSRSLRYRNIDGCDLNGGTFAKLGSDQDRCHRAPARWPAEQGSTMAQIILDHIDKVYSGGVKAIDQMSLEVKDGEFMVLVGPSGCGKSTALLSIAGLEEISSGTISIGDRVVNDLPPKDRDIAMVFQNYALYPHMTVEQNLAFGLQLRKTPRAEIQRRVKEAAEMLGLDQYLKRKPAALSGGQRQRVAMGRAIVREPQAFLVDKPLCNLDAKLRVSMRASLNQLHQELGTTTIYVTHDQVEAMTLGHRVCVMRDGRLQQVDTPQHLFESPVNLFVAGFIGSPAMNFVTAPLSRGDGPPVGVGRCQPPVAGGLIDRRPRVDQHFR